MRKHRLWTIAAVLASTFVIAAAAQATAKTRWERRHSRRDQVNDRLQNQNRRIKKERREGEITGAQAQALHQQDRQLRQEERAMASQHGGHITKGEQAALNQRENAVSRQIGR